MDLSKCREQIGIDQIKHQWLTERPKYLGSKKKAVITLLAMQKRNEEHSTALFNWASSKCNTTSESKQGDKFQKREPLTRRRNHNK